MNSVTHLGPQTVALSFSGRKSREAAAAFQKFIASLLPHMEALIPEDDIALGEDWRLHLSSEVREADASILFVTKDNIDKPWLAYHSGYLSERGRVFLVYLVDVAPADIPLPLATVESFESTREGTLALINRLVEGTGGYPKQLEVYEEWPALARRLNEIRSLPPVSVNAVAAIGSGSIVVGSSNVVISSSNYNSSYIAVGPISADQAFERIGAAVRQNLEQLRQNFDQARSESRQFFRFTITFASLGFLVVLGGVVLLLSGQITAGVVASIASIIPEATAALFFGKDRELRQTIENYHQHILQSQKLLTMVDLCETIRDEAERDRMKQGIIRTALDIA